MTESNPHKRRETMKKIYTVASGIDGAKFLVTTGFAERPEDVDARDVQLAHDIGKDAQVYEITVKVRLFGVVRRKCGPPVKRASRIRPIGT